MLFSHFSKERNIIEAASAGASASVKLVANIAANLIAFMAILAFINATLSWFGTRVGITDPELTFEVSPCYSFMLFFSNRIMTNHQSFSVDKII